MPPLGSLAIQSPTPTYTVHVSPTTCHDLSLFKGAFIRHERAADLLKTLVRSYEGIPKTRRLNNDANESYDCSIS
jgi:hypothetical protein